MEDPETGAHEMKELPKDIVKSKAVEGERAGGRETDGRFDEHSSATAVDDENAGVHETGVQAGDLNSSEAPGAGPKWGNDSQEEKWDFLETKGPLVPLR